MPRRQSLSLCLAVLAVGFAARPVRASTIIIDPASVAATPADDSYASSNLITNDGLDAPLNSGPAPASYPNLDATAASFSDYRQTPSSATPTLAFTLSTASTVTGAHIYNYFEDFGGNYYNDRGTQTANVSYSIDNGLSYIPLDAITIPEAPTYPYSTVGPYPGSDIPFELLGVPVTLVDVTNIDVQLTAIWGSGYSIGLGKVRFIDSVPEPASSGLLALAALGLLRRRRAC